MTLPHLIDPRGSRVGIHRVVPRQQHLLRLLIRTRRLIRGRSAAERDAAQERHQAACGNRHVVILHAHHVRHRMRRARSEKLGDPRRAVRIGACVMPRFRVRVIRREQVLIGRDEESVLGIDHVRQRVDRKEAAPLVASVARHRNEARPVRPERRDAHGLIPDVSLAIGPLHVL